MLFRSVFLAAHTDMAHAEANHPAAMMTVMMPAMAMMPMNHHDLCDRTALDHGRLGRGAGRCDRAGFARLRVSQKRRERKKSDEEK